VKHEISIVFRVDLAEKKSYFRQAYLAYIQLKSRAVGASEQIA